MVNKYMKWCSKLYVMREIQTKTIIQFSSVQSFSRVWLLATPWIAARQAFLSVTNSRSSLRLTSIESVMPSSHLILFSPSPPAPNPSQHQSLFQWVNSSHEVAKVVEIIRYCYIPIRASLLTQSVKILPAVQETRVWVLGLEDPLRRKWQPTAVFLTGNFRAQRSLAGYSPWGRKELDMSEHTS